MSLVLPDGRSYRWNPDALYYAEHLFELKPLTKRSPEFWKVITAPTQNKGQLATRSKHLLRALRKMLVNLRRWRADSARLRELVVPEAVSNGVADLTHPVVQLWISQVQFSLQQNLLSLRVGGVEEKVRIHAEKQIEECERKLQRVGGTALIEAARKAYTKDNRARRTKRFDWLTLEAQPIFEFWKRLKRCDNEKKLRGSAAQAAKRERERRVIEKITVIQHPNFVAGSPEYYEEIHRDFLTKEPLEECVAHWVLLFEQSPTVGTACEFAVYKRLAEEFPNVDEDSLKTSVRLGRRTLRKNT